MALKFKLVMRKNLGEDHESIPEKVYAQMVYGDRHSCKYPWLIFVV